MNNSTHVLLQTKLKAQETRFPVISCALSSVRASETHKHLNVHIKMDLNIVFGGYSK